jgi:NADH-quinone oxidoreductase subunit A
MLRSYVPLLLHALIAIGFATFTLFANILLGRSGRRSKIKDTAYECGVIPDPGPQPRFSVKFYLVAMLFILFDIEIVFMYPWAVVFKTYVANYGTIILWSMLSFVGILLFGYAYAVKKGALDWSGRDS